MCGIFGWIKPAAKTETDLDLTAIFKFGLVETQTRGEHATGFYTTTHGVVKDSIPASEFVNRVPDISSERFVLGHCRQASAKFDEDNQKDPQNAHPFESKRWIVIHNGTMDWPKVAGYKYTSDTDSETILAHVEKIGIRKTFAKIKQSTVVLFDKVQKKIYFWTDGGRPLAIAYYHGMIFFGSTKTILSKSLKVERDLKIFPKISYAAIYENELLEFDLTKNQFFRRGIIEHKEVTVTVPVVPNWVTEKKYNGNKPNFSFENIPRGCVRNPTIPQIEGPKVIRISSAGNRSYTVKD
jgi:predicted glutamine amidotransferase